MPPSKPDGTQSGLDSGAVAIEADLVERLVSALERIGTAFTPSEVKDGNTLLAHIIGQGGGTGEATREAGPVRAGAARDYDVLRGLLGRPGAPHPLRMHRERHSLVVDDPLPVSACVIVVQSPGDGRGPVTECVDALQSIELQDVSSKMPIWRAEVFNGQGQLVAFGPALPQNY